MSQSQRKPTRFVAFYSHKGGVGRSMALCNVAYVLAKKGSKVLLIDLDLEAPGLHQSDLFLDLFQSPMSKGSETRGLLDLIERWSEEMLKPTAYDWRLSDHIVQSTSAFSHVDPNSDDAAALGSMHLLPAGHQSGYRERLIGLRWDRFYQDYEGRSFFGDLQEMIRIEGFDYALIDSRTGLSDVFYIATMALADTVVLLSSLNRQNIDGTRNAYEVLTSRDAEEKFGKKNIQLVLTPLPGAEAAIELRLSEIASQWPELDIRASNDLPYVPELALREETRCRTLEFRKYRADSDPYFQGILRLCDDLATNKSPPIRPPMYTESENPFLSIRTDFHDEASLERYYVDPSHQIVEAMEAFMPTIVEGARGSGKTMLARNYSYELAFVRKEVREKCRTIGLYFRLDVDLLRSFDTRDDDLRLTFNRLFGCFWDLLVLRKALAGLDATGVGLEYWLETSAQRRLFAKLARELGKPANDLDSYQAFVESVIEAHLAEIRLYLNNPDHARKPIISQDNVLLKLLLDSLRRAKNFGDRFFVVMVDEYENFRRYQQRIVNTRLKQSKRDDAVTYKMFIRHGGLKTPETEADGQPIQIVHDYRSFRLDEDIDLETFRDHMRKVVGKHLQQSRFAHLGVNDIDLLLASIDIEAEAQRLASRGRAKVLENWVDNHPNLLAAEKRMVRDWLARQSSLLRCAVAMVVINQGKKADQVIAAFDGDTEQARNWLHNYRRGALFWLCALKRESKLYAGFGDVVGVAGFNVRYCLDQCHAIVGQWLTLPPERRVLPIPVDQQSEAIQARAQSYKRALLEEGEHARELTGMIERLGRIFNVLHRSPKQSEPEINHFKLKGEISERSEAVLRAAHGAGALRRLAENKQKSLADVRGEVWQLHPRFAPLFGISWRKKKQLELSGEDFETILWGDDATWRGWLRLFEKKHDVGAPVDESQMPLAFSDDV